MNILEDGQVYVMYSHEYYYVGVHVGDIFKDNYYGSCIAWTNVIKKYGKDNCIRTVLESFHNRDDKNRLEKKYIKIYKQKYGSKCLNISDGGTGGNLGEEVCKKISIATSGERNGMFGKKLSDQTKLLISKKLKGHPNYNFTHYKHTEDAKKRIGLANRNRKVSDFMKQHLRECRLNQKNLNLCSNKNKHWYINCDRTIEKFFLDSEVPDGWIKGRLHQKTKNKIYCNNGQTELLVNNINEIPDGFFKGRKKRKYSLDRNKKISESLSNRILSEQTRQKISNSIRGRHWFNNGIQMKQCYECPDGWKKGKILKNKGFNYEKINN